MIVLLLYITILSLYYLIFVVAPFVCYVVLTNSNLAGDVHILRCPNTNSSWLNHSAPTGRWSLVSLIAPSAWPYVCSHANHHISEVVDQLGFKRVSSALNVHHVSMSKSLLILKETKKNGCTTEIYQLTV